MAVIKCSEAARAVIKDYCRNPGHNRASIIPGIRPAFTFIKVKFTPGQKPGVNRKAIPKPAASFVFDPDKILSFRILGYSRLDDVGRLLDYIAQGQAHRA